MSKQHSQTAKQQQRTTVIYAVGTFVALSLIALVAWSLTNRQPPVAGVAQASAIPAAAPAAEEHQHLEGDFERISIADLKPLIDKGEVTVIDVRSMDQYVAAHIPGSMHIPVARIEGEVPYLPKDKLIVTYCTCPAEESSGEAALILAHAGIKAKALQGGLGAWTGLGYPTEAMTQ